SEPPQPASSEAAASVSRIPRCTAANATRPSGWAANGRDGLLDRRLAADQVERGPDRAALVQNGEKGRGDVVAADLATRDALPRLDAPRSRLVRQSPGPGDRPVQAAPPQLLVGPRLGAEVDGEHLVP